MLVNSISVLQQVYILLWAVLKLLYQKVPRLQPQPIGLVQLPPEVLDEIMKLLDWQDILRLRQTCKLLSDATRTKSIWINLFNASNSCHPCSPLRLEHPMELYTAHELEYLVLRRSSAEILRKSQTKLLPNLTRRFPMNHSDARAFSLIHGGRWLLTASETGSVSYLDLDAQDLTKRLLISEQMERLPDSIHRILMAVDSDNEFNPSSFNIAMFMLRILPIRFELNSSKSVMCASKSMNKTFITIAAAVRGQRDVPAYISIVDWAAAGIHNETHPGSLSYPRTTIPYGMTPGNARLLPGDQVLLLTESGIQLFDTKLVETTTNVPPNFSHQQIEFPHPTWCFPIHLLTDVLSHPYLCRNTNTSRLIFKSLKSVHGLIIPVDPSLGLEPQVIVLMDLDMTHEMAFTFGYNGGIMHDSAPCLHMLDYSWPDDISICSSNYLITEFNGGYWDATTCAFDEMSGRVVVYSDNEPSELIVVDFSRI
ncbi:hypothetical protein AMATHDRAFT_43600 [Amanita thiersii Skay4041]|uniref:F-box domain-containing protein n=1 Tax=Amanita thiersii Skay4041 TaxID=703135 RepID=A0A2A9NDX0_9AGAR|nr:hypothetical protein AMATHDRAFT_43600 [Amanita thiersii Skay4041]